MADNTFIKASKVVLAGLGVLQRETILPQLVWKDGIGDFSGAYNDTVSVRVPAYMVARTRTLRAGTPLTMDNFEETKVDVTLDKDVYKGVNISDEEMTLDIADFQAEVGDPVLRAIVTGVEDALADEITGANYATTVDFDDTDPYHSITSARKALNDANVPASGRVLVVGSSIEQFILEALKDAPGAASDQSALRDATIGRYAGFQIVSHNSIPPDEAYAFHKTAFILVTRAPIVPAGATWGASQSYQGLSLRVLRDYDPLYVRDRYIGSVYVGTAVVNDYGDINNDGQFVPDATPGSGTPILVRAVKLSWNGS
jgi:hypothetical protein